MRRTCAYCFTYCAVLNEVQAGMGCFPTRLGMCLPPLAHACRATGSLDTGELQECRCSLMAVIFCINKQATCRCLGANIA